MRLIDEETLKKSIEKWLNPDPNADRMVDIDDIAVSVMMEIEEQPTAYDVDKVVAELEEVQEYHATGRTPSMVRALQTAYVRTKKRLDEYIAIGTPEQCREAVEKQTGKKPTAVLGIFGGTENECKNCGNDVRYRDEYCRWCGQKLDWSDSE